MAHRMALKVTASADGAERSRVSELRARSWCPTQRGADDGGKCHDDDTHDEGCKCRSDGTRFHSTTHVRSLSSPPSRQCPLGIDLKRRVPMREVRDEPREDQTCALNWGATPLTSANRGGRLGTSSPRARGQRAVARGRRLEATRHSVTRRPHHAHERQPARSATAIPVAQTGRSQRRSTTLRMSIRFQDRVVSSAGDGAPRRSTARGGRSRVVGDLGSRIECSTSRRIPHR